MSLSPTTVGGELFSDFLSNISGRNVNPTKLENVLLSSSGLNLESSLEQVDKMNQRTLFDLSRRIGMKEKISDPDLCEKVRTRLRDESAKSKLGTEKFKTMKEAGHALPVLLHIASTDIYSRKEHNIVLEECRMAFGHSSQNVASNAVCHGSRAITNLLIWIQLSAKMSGIFAIKLKSSSHNSHSVVYISMEKLVANGVCAASASQMQRVYESGTVGGVSYSSSGNENTKTEYLAYSLDSYIDRLLPFRNSSFKLFLSVEGLNSLKKKRINAVLEIARELQLRGEMKGKDNLVLLYRTQCVSKAKETVKWIPQIMTSLSSLCLLPLDENLRLSTSSIFFTLCDGKKQLVRAAIQFNALFESGIKTDENVLTIPLCQSLSKKSLMNSESPPYLHVMLHFNSGDAFREYFSDRGKNISKTPLNEELAVSQWMKTLNVKEMTYDEGEVLKVSRESSNGEEDKGANSVVAGGSNWEPALQGLEISPSKDKKVTVSSYRYQLG